MKRIIALLLLATMFSFMCSSGKAEDNLDPNTFFEYLLSHITMEPVTEIEIGEKEYRFEYNNGKRVMISEGNWSRTFEYSGEVLLRQRGEITMEFYYSNGQYTGFRVADKEYYFIRDEIDSVVALKNATDEVICKYLYDGANSSVVWLSKDDTDRMAATNNPFRYRGWYYDIEPSLYYLGEGIFYNPLIDTYIQNQYIMDFSGEEPGIFQALGSAYTTMMNMSSYGASYCPFPSQSAWNSGVRWYDGLQQIELAARCIYAENYGVNRQSDRKAIGLVIRNRVAQNFPHVGTLSYYNIVRYPNAFSTVNPTGTISSMENDTYSARQVMSKTDSVFQHATLIACALYCSNDYNDYSLLVGIPTDMDSSYTHFVSVNYAYGQNAFSITGGQWSYGGNNIFGVCIAGTAMLTSFSGTGSNCLETYYLNGYNVFFHY